MSNQKKKNQSKKMSFQQQGVALVAVLWLVASISLMVVGMTQSIRNEVRLASMSNQALIGDALGQAAIHIILQNMQSNAQQETQRQQVRSISVPFQGVDIQVRITPLNGLIDLNNAPQPLLQAMFRFGAGLDAAQAEAIAQTIASERSVLQTKQTSSKRLFESAEDLLKIQGIHYDVYAKVAGFVTADLSGSGRVNPLAAPIEVLLILADGNAAAAEQIVAQRAGNSANLDTSALNGAMLETTQSRRFRFEALVPMSDNSTVLSTRFVDFREDSKSGLPWRVFHTERRIQNLTSTL